MKKIKLLLVVLASMTAVLMSACDKTDPKPEGNPNQHRENIFIVDGDTLQIVQGIFTEDLGECSYAFVLSNTHRFILVTQEPLQTGEYEFLGSYDSESVVTGFIPSTCAPEYFDRGTIKVERNQNHYDLDIECRTSVDANIEAHFCGDL